MNQKEATLLAKGHPFDIARMIESAPSKRQFELLDQLPIDRLNDVVIELSDNFVLNYLVSNYVDRLNEPKKKEL